MVEAGLPARSATLKLLQGKLDLTVVAPVYVEAHGVCHRGETGRAECSRRSEERRVGKECA